jgi:hypothetical protein
MLQAGLESVEKLSTGPLPPIEIVSETGEKVLNLFYISVLGNNFSAEIKHFQTT